MSAPTPAWLAATARARDAVSTALANVHQDALVAEQEVIDRQALLGDAANTDPQALAANDEANRLAGVSISLREAHRALEKILAPVG